MQTEANSVPGAVELREELPLTAGAGAGGGGGAWCAGGPRLILACFGALSVAITVALFTQIYYGDYEVVPHGGVSTDAAVCSEAGAGALKAGGRAMDAAAAAALCLAVLQPHLTSLDASGSLLYWDYRRRLQPPTLAEWGAGAGTDGGAGTGRPPRMLAALAALHAELGALPWATVLQPAVHLAKGGFPVSEGLAAALATESTLGAPTAATTAPKVGSLRKEPELATYLESLQYNTSGELSLAWGAGAVRQSAAVEARAGAWRLYVGGARAGGVQRALAAALEPPPKDADARAVADARVVSALQREAAVEGSGWALASGTASGLAVVDSFDAYLALVTGLSTAFGSGPTTAGAGWARDEAGAQAPLDLAPALLLDAHVCGTRYVLGGESGAALAQAATALATGDGDAGDVERKRVALASTPAESARAVNVVRQRGDALLSHADSRGGGIASRF